MILARTVASQMTPAEFDRSVAEFQCKDYILDAHGSRRTFDGWQKVWKHGSQDDAYLPELSVGEKVKAIDIKMEEKETQPPSRFSEASTVKQMEKLGVGRPSTFASTLDTLKNRQYITTAKKVVHVTDLGIRVSDFLVESNFCFVDLNFTSEMEEKLDAVANKQADKVQTLSEFWERLKHDIANAKEKKKEIAKTGFPCPLCAKKGIKSYLVKKYSKFGAFLGCERYKDKEYPCKYIAQVGKDGKPVEKQKKKVEYSEYLCPQCKAKMVVRESKYGKFLGCSKFPSCKGMRDIHGEEIKPKKGNKSKKSKSKKTKKA
jgi:DNA topoisomerase-1